MSSFKHIYFIVFIWQFSMIKFIKRSKLTHYVFRYLCVMHGPCMFFVTLDFECPFLAVLLSGNAGLLGVRETSLGWGRGGGQFASVLPSASGC